jgi:phosphate:Na+ symporter
MNLFDVFYLLGGLAMFLFGMHLMGESLERQAGRRLKSILGQLTNKPLKGVLLGTAVTAVIQSSSATTVMVVGFVNSGIMQLNQAIPVIMGANIGTTITSWILSLTGIRSDSLLMTLLKPSTFSPLIAFAGIVLLLTSRRRRDTAGIMLGFSVLMFGMEQMSAAVAGLAEVPAFRELLVLFTNPLFGVAVGALVTAIIQSSSASVGILQAIANTGSLTYGAALPIIMGQNIGTCITAILSSIGANRNAKRVGMVHLYFNLIGTGVFLSVFYVLDWLIGFTFTALPINAFGIAVAHTSFNIGTVILLYPMRSLLEWLARKTIRDSKESEKMELLDQRLLNTPSVAIEQCRRLTVDMANLAQQAFLLADGLLDQYDAKAATEVEEIEQTVDRYEDRLGAYLLQVSALHLSEYESKEVSKLLYGIGDFERISDHAVNLTEVAQELHTKNIGFSPEAQVETSTMRAAVKEIMALTVKVFDTNNQELARKVEPLEEVVDVLRETIKANHIERLRTGTCTIELGFVLSDLLTNLERISDHCSNIAVNVMEQTGRGGLESHAYLHELHEGAPNSSFRMQYEAYLNKYDIASKLDELALPEGAE